MAKRGKKFTEAAKLVEHMKAIRRYKKRSNLRKKQAQLILTQQSKLHSVLESILVKMTNKSVEQLYFQTVLVKLNVFSFSLKVKNLKKLKLLVQTMQGMLNISLKFNKVGSISTLSLQHLT